ncbi:MAG: CBS domain-containing protein [SAR324 cluster bacterium]|uniref:CBS domain-containing protein n=1 Tax=SAR324 cluster bacterium TaxID=2024889 RepID=A0A7X9FUI4_9DELT|nr:CBS domain-containing protein [SAR324 cluster bacterium]
MSVENIKRKGDSAILTTIKSISKQRIGVLDAGFLSRSVGLLNTPPAVCLSETASVQTAINLMRERHIGCVLLVNSEGKLTGMFSERDLMERIICSDLDRNEIIISDYMTKNPVTINFTVSLAYGLSLMAMGGFRHLPVVDNEGVPLGVVSVKDIVNYITGTFMDDVLNFEVAV